MPAATTTPPSASPRPSATLSKMEDRKRPAVNSTDDLAPPSKRVAVNGSKVKDEALEMKEESWVEAYAKGAIYRQMQEYGRKATTAESRLEELHKRSVHHDDHLRIVDAWWLQLMEELELLAGAEVSSTDISAGPPYLSNVSFKDLQEFQTHLQDKGKTVKAKAEALLSRLAADRGEIGPDAAKLEGKVTALLASQKEFLLKLDRLNSEKDQLSEQLNAATLRYFKAEKKLDRAKSAQVQKLEQQAFANATKPASEKDDGTEAKETTNGNYDEMLAKYEEAMAAATKQKEQLDNLLAEIKTIQEENSAMKAKRDAWTDEDFIRTDVFKQFKSQNEDLIKRINNLETTNKQLREEAEKLQAERSAFRAQLEADASQFTSELEAEILQKDEDLSRVRAARDEYFAENKQRQLSEEEEKVSLEMLKEASAAKDDRIAAFEAEVARLKASEDEAMASAGDEELDKLSPDELRARCKKLQSDYASINQELPAITKAFTKFKDLAMKKIADTETVEARIKAARNDKNRTDQKYFAASKDASTRNNEIKALRHQSAKSTEIIAQLKENEASNRTLVNNLEKQLADLRSTNASLLTESKKMETMSLETSRKMESSNKQILELTNLVKSKDSAHAVVRERNIMQEAEVEKLKVRLENMQKDRDNWKDKAIGNSSEEEEMLRSLATCSVCRSNFKNTALRTCGHTFCNKCIENRISNRMRKCPNCSRAFDKSDLMSVHMN